MTGKLSKEEAAELRGMAATWCLSEKIESMTPEDAQEYERRAALANAARAAFEWRLAELTEG